MKRLAGGFALFFALVGPACAQDLGALFQKAKEQVKTSSFDAALKTLDALDTESRKPGLEKARTQLEPALAFYRAVCLANLDKPGPAQEQFEIFLGFTPNASLDRAMYSKKVIAALDDARKTVAKRGEPAPGMPSLAGAYRGFRLSQAVPVEPPREDWGNGPARFLMTPEEKREWERQSDAVARSEFVTKFWAARDPKPETPENEFRQEFERRVAFADQNLAQGETRGALTDRGMVFLLLGPPTYVGRKPIGAGEDASEASGNSTVGRHDAETAAHLGAANRASSGQTAAAIDRVSGPGTQMADSSANSWREIWHYRKELLPPGVPYQQVDFDFITRKGYGQNVLQREAATLNTLESARKATAWAAAAGEKKS